MPSLQQANDYEPTIDEYHHQSDSQWLLTSPYPNEYVRDESVDSIDDSHLLEILKERIVLLEGSDLAPAIKSLVSAY